MKKRIVLTVGFSIMIWFIILYFKGNFSEFVVLPVLGGIALYLAIGFFGVAIPSLTRKETHIIGAIIVGLLILLIGFPAQFFLNQGIWGDKFAPTMLKGVGISMGVGIAYFLKI